MNTNTVAQQIFDALHQYGPLTAVQLSTHVEAAGSDISSACSRLAWRTKPVLEEDSRVYSERCKRLVIVWRLRPNAVRPLSFSGRPLGTFDPPPPSRPIQASRSDGVLRRFELRGIVHEVIWSGEEGLTRL